MDLRDSKLRFEESGFADTINDILKKKFNVDFVFNNSGMFRGDRVYKNCKITDVMLHVIFDFDSTVCKMKLKGRYIKNILKHSVENYGSGGWLQIADIRYEIDKPAYKETIYKEQKALNRCLKNITVDGKPIEDNRTCAVLTNDFLCRGGNGYKWFKLYGKDRINTYTTFYSIIEGHIEQKGGVLRLENTDGRIKIIKNSKKHCKKRQKSEI